MFLHRLQLALELEQVKFHLQRILEYLAVLELLLLYKSLSPTATVLTNRSRVLFFTLVSVTEVAVMSKSIVLVEVQFAGK